MSKTTAPAEAAPQAAPAPSFPNASIDFNAVLDAAASGATGDAMLVGAILVEPRMADEMPVAAPVADAGPVTPAAPEPPAPGPKKSGDAAK